MQTAKLDDVREAVLAANSTVTRGERRRVKWLYSADGAQDLWALRTAVNKPLSFPGGKFAGEQAKVAGLAWFDSLRTWHPVCRESRPTAAQVLAQLSRDVREQVTGVWLPAIRHYTSPNFKEVDLCHHTQPTSENGFLRGWVPLTADLFRAARPVALEVDAPFELPDWRLASIERFGFCALTIGCERDGDRWSVTVQARSPFAGVKVIEQLRTEPATHHGAASDVLEAMRHWITAGLPEGLLTTFCPQTAHFLHLERETRAVADMSVITGKSQAPLA
jgi:hypothetical protein